MHISKDPLIIFHHDKYLTDPYMELSSRAIEELIKGIIPKENGLKRVEPPPPEYILITCINELRVSNFEKALSNAS